MWQDFYNALCYFSTVRNSVQLTSCAASLCRCRASSSDRDRAARASLRGEGRSRGSRGYSSAASAVLPPPPAHDSLRVRFRSDPANL